MAIQTHSSPVETHNQGDQEYQNWKRWSSPVYSYLLSNSDGTFTRVEYTGEVVAVEEYSADYQFISGFSIEPELPLFGGFYSGETHNFLVFGQENNAEDDSVEVIRVVCYTKDWQRVGADSLYGANTTIPFHGGSLRFAEYNGYLYIRTCHQMYTARDGRRHQANVMINFRISDTAITDSYWQVMNSAYGYVSHSFNQFVLVDEGKLLTVDHGDAHPRSVALMRYHAPAGQDSFMMAMVENSRLSYVKQVDILPMAGGYGANDTGVAVGGFAASSSAYLIAGNTIVHEENADLFGQRNMFISVTSKTDFSDNGTTIRYLTAYQQGDNVDVSTPHLVKLSDDRFVVLWTEITDTAETFRYCFVDGQGNLQGQVYTTTGVLSDCVPVVAGNKLVWYVTAGGEPAFFTIDLENPEDLSHEHLYNYKYSAYPSYYQAGSLSSTCAVCGEEGPTVVVPSIKNLEHYEFVKYSSEPTCTSYGYAYYRWKDAERYGVGGWSFGVYQPELGHEWTEGDCKNPPTCTRCGEIGQISDHSWQAATCTAPETCAVCGENRGEPKSHDYKAAETKAPTCTEDGQETFTCTICGDSYTETIEMTGHDYRDTVVGPTCTAGGYVLHTCTVCGDSYQDQEVSASGHSYETVVTQPTVEEQGYTTYTCTACGHSFVDDWTEPVGYSLSGTVTSYLHDEAVTVELLRDGKVVDSVSLSGQSVQYDFRGLEAGNYTLRISKRNHVPVEVAVSTAAEQPVVNVTIYPVGDVTRDGSVNVKDYQRLLRHINKTKPLTEEEMAYADLTGEGSVNVKDYQRLLRHINRTNPLY